MLCLCVCVSTCETKLRIDLVRMRKKDQQADIKGGVYEGNSNSAESAVLNDQSICLFD